MYKLRNNQQGFGAVEIILVVAVIVLLGVAGWLVYRNHHKATNTSPTTTTSNIHKTSSTSSQTADPYAGWKSYTLKYEQATFKYPAGWTLKNTPPVSPTDTSDSVNLTAPDGFGVEIATGGLGHPSYDGPTTVLAAVPVTFAGKAGYADYVSLLDKGMVDVLSLSKSQTNFLDTFTSKASGENEEQAGNFTISAFYATSNGAYIGKSLTAAKSDPNYQDALLLIKSMQY